MRKILIFLFLLITSISFAENVPKDSSKQFFRVSYPGYPYMESVSLFYSNKYLSKNIESQLHNTNIKNPLEAVTVSLIGLYRINRIYSFPGIISLSYYIPHNVNINSESPSKLYSYEFKTSLAGQFLFRREHFYIAITEGISFGRIKIKHNGDKVLKNPSFSPFIGMFSGLTISKIRLNFMVCYDFDISRKKWKYYNESDVTDFTMPNLNQSGFLVNIGIGYAF